VREDDVLVGLWFGSTDVEDLGPRDDEANARVRRQLDEYFAGTRTSFDLAMRASGNPLQMAVWKLIADIPYGATRSYGDLARDLGDRTLALAVGTACGRNPLPVVVPCHRVVGADGSLVGFGGGLDRKRFLLDLEHREERLF
jgi:methylated-DNA-[protein]-cysteine S-methyltransferase